MSRRRVPSIHRDTGCDQDHVFFVKSIILAIVYPNKLGYLGCYVVFDSLLYPWDDDEWSESKR